MRMIAKKEEINNLEIIIFGNFLEQGSDVDHNLKSIKSYLKCMCVDFFIW